MSTSPSSESPPHPSCSVDHLHLLSLPHSHSLPLPRPHLHPHPHPHPHLHPLDHRLDIAPSPSPPPHLVHPSRFHHSALVTTPATNNITTTHSPHLHISPDLFPPHPTHMRPPPPPKKRDRLTTEQSGSNSSDQHLRTINAKRPAKKEKPAPVTMVYRGAPDDLLIHPEHMSPSVQGLPPQTAFHRAIVTDDPPSTIAPSYSLSHATEASLMKKKHHRLRDLCHERGLLAPDRELNKREMVQALLGWREYNIANRISMVLSETEDSMMYSSSEFESSPYTASPTRHDLTAETSLDDSIDPQLIDASMENPAVYNLRNRAVIGNGEETIKSRKPASPHSQLANFFATTAIDQDIVMHPPTIPLLDDPARNSKRKSIRLVGTKIPSLGPISKFSVSQILVNGSGPIILDSSGAPGTAKGAIMTLKNTGASNLLVPPSPPTSSDTSQDMLAASSTFASEAEQDKASGGEDLDVLLDLEDLRLSDKEIPPEKLAREQKVGSGSFKDVYMGRYRNFRVAICDLRGRLTDMDIKELGLLRDLRHPNIVRFIGVSVGGAVPCTIVTELCRNGDLYDYIRKIPCPPYVQILAMMLDAARGVEYLHERTPSIIHRDLKSPNVLITANGSAKITDFGLARVKRDVMSMCATTCGTLNWQAPELWVARPSYNHSIDVYALGLVFWEVLSWSFKEKTYPFQGMNEHAIFAEVGKNGLRPSTSMIRRKWGRDIVVLVERMWDQNSEERPVMPEVVRILCAMLLQEREKSWPIPAAAVNGAQIRQAC